MKKITTVLAFLVYFSANGQVSESAFSIGVAGNYTMYKGSFQQSTPGFKVEAGYGLRDGAAITLGFTKASVIKYASSISSSDGTNTTSTSSEIVTNFTTVSLIGQYRVVGDDETAFNLYIPVGGSYVMAKYEEKETQAIPTGYTPTDKMEPGKQSGFTLNLGVGAQYSLGTPMVFGEAGLALPANKVGNTYVENYIPAHFIFNVGVRFSFGGMSGY